MGSLCTPSTSLRTILTLNECLQDRFFSLPHFSSKPNLSVTAFGPGAHHKLSRLEHLMWQIETSSPEAVAKANS